MEMLHIDSHACACENFLFASSFLLIVLAVLHATAAPCMRSGDIESKHVCSVTYYTVHSFEVHRSFAVPLLLVYSCDFCTLLSVFGLIRH